MKYFFSQIDSTYKVAKNYVVKVNIVYQTDNITKIFKWCVVMKYLDSAEQTCVIFLWPFPGGNVNYSLDCIFKMRQVSLKTFSVVIIRDSGMHVKTGYSN